MKINQRRNEFALADVTLGIQDGGKQSMVDTAMKDFKQTVRVTRETFNFLLSKIEHDITKKETAETPISASKRLAVRLYKLARGDY